MPKPISSPTGMGEPSVRSPPASKSDDRASDPTDLLRLERPCLRRDAQSYRGICACLDAVFAEGADPDDDRRAYNDGTEYEQK